MKEYIVPEMIGRHATSLAVFLPGTKRTSFEILPMVMYNGQALCFAFPDRRVLSDVKIIGIMVAVMILPPLASRKLLTSS